MPEVDTYVAKFKQLVRKSGYTLGSWEMNQHFIAGLPMSVTEDILKDPKPTTYLEILQKTLASVCAKQTIWALYKKGSQGQTNNYRPHKTTGIHNRTSPYEGQPFYQTTITCHQDKWDGIHPTVTHLCNTIHLMLPDGCRIQQSQWTLVVPGPSIADEGEETTLEEEEANM